MDIIDGQFDDAEDDNRCSQQTTHSDVLDAFKSFSTKESIKCEEEEEENDDYDDDDDDDNEDGTLESVEWNTQTSNITRQYMQFVGKVSGGTNPQNKTFNESVVKKYQNNLNLGMYNPLMGKSFRKADDHVSKHKDKSDQATVEKALDKRTTMILYKLLNRVYTGIDGCISTGKEANVYHATSKDGRSLAVKVFKTVGSEFRNRDQYMAGEYRFRFNTCTKDIRKLVPKWAEKEFRNLHRIFKAGIPSPEPVHLNNNVLVMEFLGEDGRPAAKLKDVTLSCEQAEKFYVDCIGMMRTMFQECKLVHADLSEFNLLVIRGKLYMIDVSQSVEMDNENAMKFLKMDVKNVTMFFRKQGITTMALKRLLEFIMNPEIHELESFVRKAIEDAASGNDADENDLEDQVEISRTLGEFESYGKDLRRMDDKRILHEPLFTKKSEAINEEEAVSSGDEDDEQADSDCSDGDESIETEKDSKKNEDQAKYYRPRDESPESKKERKKAIKEVQRTNRKNKIPKADKKRRIKVSKNKKS